MQYSGNYKQRNGEAGERESGEEMKQDGMQRSDLDNVAPM